MPPNDALPPQAPERRPNPALLIVVACVAAGLALVAARIIAKSEAPKPAEAVTVVEPSPSVVVALEQLARLEGAVFYMERVVDLREKQSHFFDLIQSEDAVLLVAGGDVTAGVDLGHLSPDAVEADPLSGRVRISLPHAKIFSRRLDNNRTYVHTRQTDTLAVRRENLETRARQEAERTLEQAALDGGILAKAEDSVGRTVQGLLRSLGYRQIEVRFVDEAETAAPARGERG